MKKLELTQGFFTKVDDADYEFLMNLKKKYGWKSWYYTKRERTGYAVHKYGRGVYLHRLLLRPPVGLDVDHINGDGLDNRRKNLRAVTRSQNTRNNYKVGYNLKFN